MSIDESTQTTPLRAAPRRRKGITLVARGTTVWLFVLAVVALVLIWALESAAGQITASDRWAYPALIAWFIGLLVMIRRRKHQLVLAQGLGSMGLGAYFVFSTFHMLLLAPELSAYSAASMVHWLIGAHLLVFATWPAWRALALSSAVLVLTMVPVLIVHFGRPYPPGWTETLWPLYLNGAFAQVLMVAALFGITYQLRRLSVLAPGIDSLLDDPNSQPMTVDDLVTRRMRDLMQARDAAEDASQAKSRFLAVMSHELRTPLHGVLGAADLLRDPQLSEANRRELIDTVRRGGSHLLRLINDVLDLSRIEAGRLELTDQPFELMSSLASVMEAVQAPADAKGLPCRVAVDPSVPTWLRGDEFRFKQILINLLSNAIKFTDRGHVNLALRYEPDAHELQVYVEDTGIGIEREHQDRIFDAFHQADGGVTRRHAGTGLGLAITRQLVQLMQGQLGLQSEPGVGTRVTLRLPMEPSAPGTVAPTNSSMGPLSNGLNGVRVLLVDDDAVNTMIASQMLESAGVKVHTASTGVEALNQLTRGGYDLVLMDWRMPDMDGLEATRRLRSGEAGEHARQLPVIGFTANAYAEDRAACLAAGMDEVLVKPVGRVRLLETVQHALEGHPAFAG